MHITSICVLFVCISPSIAIVKNSFPLSREREILDGELLHTLPVLGKEWKVSFEVNPSTFEEGWRNILRLWYPYGGVTPSGASCLSISILSSRKCTFLGKCNTNPKQLSYQFLSDGQWNQWKYFHERDLFPQLNEWTKIEVSQQLEGNTYKIRFNDGAKTEDVQRPKNFEGVKVYASDPSNQTQPGKIRNLRITNLNRG